MKILWVKSGGLVPLTHGGRIRSYNLAKELASRHDVSLFTFYPKRFEEDSHADLETLFTQVITHPFQMPVAQSLADYLSYAYNLWSLRPYSVTKYCRPEVAHRLRALLRQGSYDVVVCDFLVTAGVIPWDFPVAKVLFTHNIEALIWQRQYHLSRNPLWKGVCWREFRTMERFERNYLNLGDHVLAVSGTDRNFFANIIEGSKITVVPTGVDVEFFRPSTSNEDQDALVFTGSMDWLPNEDAIFWFYDQILPRVRRDHPQVRVWVVGRRPSRRLQALAARDPALCLTGTVDDVRPYISRSAVYIVPLRVGGGTRLKIFEAMAMGKAIVSTSVGAEGLPVCPDDNIVIADRPEEFAHRVVALIKDPAARRKLSLAARRHVERNYSWTAATDRLEAALVTALRTHDPLQNSTVAR